MLSFDDPIAIFSEMERLLADQALNKALLVKKARGFKQATVQMRKTTVRIGLLGKHFRDLTVIDSQLSNCLPGNRDVLLEKKRKIVGKFALSWANINPAE